MNILKYIKDNKLFMVFFILILFVINSILITTIEVNILGLDIIYMNILIMFIFVVFFTIGYISWKKDYNDIFKNIKEDNDILLSDIEGELLEQQIMRSIIDLKNISKNSIKSKLELDISEMNDFITRWVHEMKIPISIIELLANKIEEEELYYIAEDLRMQGDRINFLVNQVLYTSRSNNYVEDFIIEKIGLDKLVKSIIRNNKNSFIYKHIKLDIGDLNYYIYTDRKWAFYVIDQIINNSCKYVDKGGEIKIYGNEDGEYINIYIEDNGVGIPKKDIDRIFDRGFTGDNGRIVSKSTGMGLYIIDKISKSLNYNIEVKSIVGEYTLFIISFKKYGEYFNVT